MPQIAADWATAEIGCPSWALIGAELQNPKNGAILA